MQNGTHHTGHDATSEKWPVEPCWATNYWPSPPVVLQATGHALVAANSVGLPAGGIQGKYAVSLRVEPDAGALAARQARGNADGYHDPPARKAHCVATPPTVHAAAAAASQTGKLDRAAASQHTACLFMNSGASTSKSTRPNLAHQSIKACKHRACS